MTNPIQERTNPMTETLLTRPGDFSNVERMRSRLAVIHSNNFITRGDRNLERYLVQRLVNLTGLSGTKIRKAAREDAEVLRAS